MSVERREVLDLLREESLTSRELARQTGRKEGAMRMLLKRLVDDNQVIKGTDGKYRLL